MYNVQVHVHVVQCIEVHIYPCTCMRIQPHSYPGKMYVHVCTLMCMDVLYGDSSFHAMCRRMLYWQSRVPYGTMQRGRCGQDWTTSVASREIGPETSLHWEWDCWVSLGSRACAVLHEWWIVSGRNRHTYCKYGDRDMYIRSRYGDRDMYIRSRYGGRDMYVQCTCKRRSGTSQSICKH